MEFVSNQDVRMWAVAQGEAVGVRGRLSKDTLRGYLKAHPQYARELAESKGLKVSKKGRLSDSLINQIV